ncbi:dihydrofolate reductase [Roseiconus lacunae]|uniref:Dihydrofolate reductase n=1 Tax=Roseiconus lacunae TaxID=2605694 RepID=A0ABT7PRL3_9BACT|nr:dihydrofolate reductase [Roseiconus lacunae]MCD0462605.1 dihydrofolate reductase [Roseiconus lacunae]MDM4019150.1 dihydrofolate reductase [Roseiconus lacunae]WRQ49004.1 dihydrofolate reductase [Stieleria sp. HD01]
MNAPVENSPVESRLTAVVAISQTGVIGRDGDMPWRLSSDLRRFKSLTMGGVLIMGRKTFDSIGRPLPGRRTIVITRQADWSSAGVEVAATPEAAIELAGQTPAFVVGGAEIYRQLIDRCEEVFLTRVLCNVEGDTHLELDVADFSVLEQSRIPAGPKDDYPTEFFRLVRHRKSTP